jgi:hypothetical protein
MRLFLLDCHIAKATVEALRKKLSSVRSEHLATWRDGAFLKSTDEEILAACQDEGHIFVTFDQRTIPDVLRRWAAEGRPHSGIVFGDENTVKPGDPGGMASALATLIKEIADIDSTNMIRFLRPTRH